MDTEQQKQDYYDVLNIDRTASRADIKRAFRRLAKRFHPDTNPERAQSATKRLKEVMTAYRVLSNERERARYDVMLRRSGQLDVRQSEGTEKPKSLMARQILEGLLDGDGQQALELYDQMAQEEGFELRSCLDIRDYLDCVFLLAEQLERAGRYREATELYEELYAREKDPPRHRYFFDEVEVRLKKLYSRKLPRVARSPEEEIGCYERILQFDIDRSEKAFILKKIAEVHLKVGETERAREVFDQALSLKPALKGTATIRERLGIEPT